SAPPSRRSSRTATSSPCVIAQSAAEGALRPEGAARYPCCPSLCWPGSRQEDQRMSYKDLLVVLDSDTASRWRVDLAAALAERFAAHLVGLYPLPVPEMPHHLSYYDPAVLDPFFLDLREQAQAASEVEREAFEHAASLRGLSVEWRVIAEGLPEADAALHARYVDLTILGQPDPDRGDLDLIRPRPEQVTFASGRPVLVVPYAGQFETVGRRVLIGWNASREATRAVNDAMPLLTAAEVVTVLTIDARQGPDAHGKL